MSVSDHAQSHLPFAQDAFLLWLGSDFVKACEGLVLPDPVEDR